jgi:hypothetical protein
MDTNSETTTLGANLMVSFFVQCNIFVNILYIGPACLQRQIILTFGAIISMEY